jgi:hypothetical protein
MGKSGLVAEPITAARMRHRLVSSRTSAPLMRLGHLILPPYLRLALRFSRIEIRQPDQIITALRDFQAGRTRLLVAFRHPYGDEPQLLTHVFDQLIPRLAKKLGAALQAGLHLRLVHDYAVPLWGDALIRYILPRAGALPVYHVKFDPVSLKAIRQVLLNDRSPLGLAPEGQISYHSEALPRIEQGAVRMGFWCAQDLARAGRPERMHILPLSVHYRYDRREIGKIRTAVAGLERCCGLPPTPNDARLKTAPEDLNALADRLDLIEERVLALTESFYATTCAYQIPGSPDVTWQQRWELLQDCALEAAEHRLGLPVGSGDRIPRVYRIRQSCWDRIYPDKPASNQAPLAEALADRQAGEAWYAMRHMEFVDLMAYHDTAYLRRAGDAAVRFDRLVETLINLQDLAARLMGGNITTRPNNLRKTAILLPGPVLDLQERLPEYLQDARSATRDATSELGLRFEQCIKEYEHETTT